MPSPRAVTVAATLVAFVALAAVATAARTSQGAQQASGLAVGARACPVLGVGVAEPELSWKLHHRARGQAQSAYRVVVRTAMPGGSNQVVWGELPRRRLRRKHVDARVGPVWWERSRAGLRGNVNADGCGSARVCTIDAVPATDTHRSPLPHLLLHRCVAHSRQTLGVSSQAAHRCGTPARHW